MTENFTEQFRNCKIIFKKDAIGDLRDELKRIGAKRIFLIIGKKSAGESGLLVRIKNILKDFEISAFCNAVSKPTQDTVKECVAAIKENNCQTVIGLGGGNVMDIAKAAAAFAKNETVSIKKNIFGDDKIFCVTVPTIAGTGAEITPFAVVYDRGQKYSLDNPIVQPNLAIIDPVLSVSAPPEPSFYSAFDALSQAIEAYWAVRSTEESDGYAEEAMKILPAAIKELAVTSDNLNARSFLAYASLLGGKAIAIARTTAPHALSYPLTINFDMPHGAAVGILLPHFLSFNYALSDADCADPRGVKFVKNKLEKISKILINKNDVSTAAGFLKDIIRSGPRIILPEINNSDIGKLLSSVNPDRLGNNPRKLNQEDIKNIYLNLCPVRDENLFYRANLKDRTGLNLNIKSARKKF